MKKYWKRILASVFVPILLLLSFSVGEERAYAATTTAPTLYCNDEVWYKDAQLPLVPYHQNYLVPVSIFSMIPGFEVSVDRQSENIVITDRQRDDYYISFNHKEEQAIVGYEGNATEFFCRTHKFFATEYYVSPQIVCEYMGLECEIYVSEYDGSVSLRISDPETAKQSFGQLLYRYNPAALGIEPEQDGTPIEPYVTGKPVYLTFNGISDTYISELLLTLRQNNVQATFFLTEEDILNNPKSVIRLYTEGHSVGIYVETEFKDSALDFDAVMEDLGAANRALFQLLKIKTRLVRLDLDDVDTTRVIAGVHHENLEYCGYVLWSQNNATYMYDYTRESVRTDILSTVEQRSIPTVCIPYTEICISALYDAIDALRQNRNYALIAISEAATEFNYINNIQ